MEVIVASNLKPLRVADNGNGSMHSAARSVTTNLVRPSEGLTNSFECDPIVMDMLLGIRTLSDKRLRRDSSHGIDPTDSRFPMRESHNLQAHALEQSSAQAIAPVIARSTGQRVNSKTHPIDHVQIGTEASTAVQDSEHCMRAKAASLLELIEQQQQLWI